MRRLLLVLVITLLVPFMPARAQEELPPYLFYYSDRYNTFVIERADGTGWRLFGENMMGPETNAVYGPGWSPSGKWFAWTSKTVHAEAPDSASQPHALSVNGTRRVTALDRFPHAWLGWIPGSDRLLVLGQDYIPAIDPITRACAATFYVAVVDPAADRVLDSLTWQMSCPDRYDKLPWASLYGRWINANQAFVLFYSNEVNVRDSLSKKMVLHIVDQSGVIVRQPVPQAFDRPILVWGPGTDHVTTYEQNTLAVENLITGERELFENVPDRVSSVEWYDNEALLVAASTELWLLERASGQLSLVTSQLENEDPVYFYETFWSPDGKYIVFYGMDNRFHLFDRSQKTTIPLTPAQEDNRDELALWWGGWHWYGDQQVLLAGIPVGDQMQAIHFCDLKTTICDTRYIPVYGYGRFPQLSTSAQYAAYVPDGVAVVDLTHDSVLSLPPDSRGYGSVRDGKVNWHPASDWFIIWDNATIAGGGGSYWTSVAHVDGSIQRELAYCWDSPVCIDWLPPQVDPAVLAPGHASPLVPAPAAVLHGDQWAFFLSWSPDSDHLLAGRDPQQSHNPAFGGPGKSILWDVASGQPASTFPLIDWNEDVHWLPTNGPGHIFRIETLDHLVSIDYYAISPDGSQRVLWDRVEDVVTGDTLVTLDGRLDCFWGYPVTVNFSPDGRWLAAPLLSVNSRIAIWDTTTWEEVGTIPGTFQAVAFSPDGRWLAASHSWNISIWATADVISMPSKPITRKNPSLIHTACDILRAHIYL